MQWRPMQQTAIAVSLLQSSRSSSEKERFWKCPHMMLRMPSVVDKKNGSQADTKSQGVYPIKAAKISIADVLDVVNSTHQSILPESVLKALGESRNPDGEYAGKVKFSLKPDSDAPSQEQRWATDFQLSAETREAYNTAAKEVARTEAEVRAMVREAQASGALAGQMNQGRRMAKQNRTLQERLDASRETIKQLKAEVRPPNRAQADPEDGNAVYGPNCSKDPPASSRSPKRSSSMPPAKRAAPMA